MQANLRPACPEDIRSLFTGFQLLFKNKIRSRSLAAFTHTLTRLQNKQKQTLVTERKKKTWHKRHISPHSSPLREVSRGGTCATQRQKFHTDDEKSVRNPVRSANWLTE